MGISAVAEAAAVRAAVALAMIRSTPSDTKPLTMVAQLVASPEALLFVNVHLTGQCFVQGVNEPLRCGVQSFVLNQLADADLVYGSVRRGVGVSRGVGGGVGLGTAAGGQRQHHGRSQSKCKHFLLHNHLLL